MIYLDTHAVWAMSRRETDRFSSRALRALEMNDDIRISPMVLLEIEFLHEIGRFKVSGERVLDVLAAEIGLRVCDTQFLLVARQAIEERWTRDPFDRIIVAHARIHGATLITLDTRIHKHYSQALA